MKLGLVSIIGSFVALFVLLLMLIPEFTEIAFALSLLICLGSLVLAIIGLVKKQGIELSIAGIVLSLCFFFLIFILIFSMPGPGPIPDRTDCLAIGGYCDLHSNCDMINKEYEGTWIYNSNFDCDNSVEYCCIRI